MVATFASSDQEKHQFRNNRNPVEIWRSTVGGDKIQQNDHAGVVGGRQRKIRHRSMLVVEDIKMFRATGQSRRHRVIESSPIKRPNHGQVSIDQQHWYLFKIDQIDKCQREQRVACGRQVGTYSMHFRNVARWKSGTIHQCNECKQNDTAALGLPRRKHQHCTIVD